jgi:7-cyano-7-deazaguanine reductase
MSTGRGGKGKGIYRGLQQLGSATVIPAAPADAVLERVPNPHPRKRYLARFAAPEFTSLCPITGQPDFGRLVIEYVPDRHLAETKSLKLYLWKYRTQAGFNESLVDAIASDLYRQIGPHWLRVTGIFNPRGGIQVTAVAERGHQEYRPQ